MLTPVRKSLRLNEQIKDVDAKDVTDLVVSGTAVYVPNLVVHTWL